MESNIANNMCKQFEADGVVCPSTLRKGLVTVGAMDNLDHNPTSTTAQLSLHGTAISITQFPTSTDGGKHRTLAPFSSGNSDESSSLLPSVHYTCCISQYIKNSCARKKNDLASFSAPGRGTVRKWRCSLV